MLNWDYKLKNNWQPKTTAEWRWFLVRKINYDDFTGLKRRDLKKHFRAIQDQLDPGKRVMLANFLKLN